MMKCTVCGDPVKRCNRRRTNYLCHTWHHDHTPRVDFTNEISYPVEISRPIYVQHQKEKVNIMHWIGNGFKIIFSVIILWLIFTLVMANPIHFNNHYVIGQHIVIPELDSSPVSRSDLYMNGYFQCDANGNVLKKIDYSNAVDVSHFELMKFIRADHTDRFEYSDNFVCANYAETVHNNAEVVGIRAGFALIEFEGEFANHMINVFKTPDGELIFVDCTEMDNVMQTPMAGHHIKYNNEYIYIDGVIKSVTIKW